MKAFRAEAMRRIREQVGKRAKVICGLSGGVDSSVAALLIHEAIGDQLTCIFVDTGLMRAGEAEEVVSLFRGHYNIPLVHADAREDCSSRASPASPTPRRSARSSAPPSSTCSTPKQRSSAPGIEFLAQGTLYPDVIESTSALGGPSATIKSHHNVGGLPERMKLKLVEPLRELFKDEVRALGRELGLPPAFVGRHPFPGPGLAIRVLGEITPERLATLRKADAIYLDEIRKAGLYDEIWQAFAVLLPVNTVGVMGDDRTYEAVCALRAVTSTDGMTADSYPFEHDFLARTRHAHRQRSERHQPRGLRRDAANRRARSSGSDLGMTNYVDDLITSELPRAVEVIGARMREITSEAAAKNALGNSRIFIEYQTAIVEGLGAYGRTLRERLKQFDAEHSSVSVGDFNKAIASVDDLSRRAMELYEQKRENQKPFGGNGLPFDEFSIDRCRRKRQKRATRPAARVQVAPFGMEALDRAYLA